MPCAFGSCAPRPKNSQIAPARHLHLRQYFQQRYHVHFAIEKVVIEILNRIGAKVLLEPGQLALQSNSGGQARSATEHGSDSAKSATEPATHRRLVGDRASTEKGPGEIPARIPQELIGYR